MSRLYVSEFSFNGLAMIMSPAVWNAYSSLACIVTGLSLPVAGDYNDSLTGEHLAASRSSCWTELATALAALN